MIFRLPQHACRAVAHLAFLLAAASATAQSNPNDPAVLARLRMAAMESSYAWDRTADLTDLIGPRLSGSPGAAAAVTQVAEAMRALGLKVTLQPVKVPHWERGIETGELIDYKARPEGVTQKVILTALGGSSATPPEGLVAPVIVVRSFEELRTRAAEVRGAIVLFDTAFDQQLADAGHASAAYSQAVKFRGGGPRLASQLGAVAALVRSVGGANFRLAHTGGNSFGDDKPIPSAAVTAEDSMLMARLAARGPLKMRLVLTPRTLPDADSFNVLADLPGTDKADEVVIISGHLDSWDLGTGAIDDASGVATAMAALETIKRLGLKPRRTIRMVAWMNEENGLRGGRAYEAAMRDQVGKHFAGIESDAGAGRPLGVIAGVRAEALKAFDGLAAALLPIGAGQVIRQDAAGAADLSPLERAGMPAFMPKVDNRDYFHYHHTIADTLDKVDPDNLRRQAAVMTLMAWYLANMPEEIGRSPAQGR